MTVFIVVEDDAVACEDVLGVKTMFGSVMKDDLVVAVDDVGVGIVLVDESVVIVCAEVPRVNLVVGITVDKNEVWDDIVLIGVDLVECLVVAVCVVVAGALVSVVVVVSPVVNVVLDSIVALEGSENEKL